METYTEGTIGTTAKTRNEYMSTLLDKRLGVAEIAQRTGLSRWEQYALHQVRQWEVQEGERMPAVELFEDLSQEVDA